MLKIKNFILQLAELCFFELLHYNRPDFYLEKVIHVFKMLGIYYFKKKKPKQAKFITLVDLDRNYTTVKILDTRYFNYDASGTPVH